MLSLLCCWSGEGGGGVGGPGQAPLSPTENRLTTGSNVDPVSTVDSVPIETYRLLVLVLIRSINPGDRVIHTQVIHTQP